MSLLSNLPLISDINACKSMYIREILAPREGVVSIVLEEGGSVPLLNPDDFAYGLLTAADLNPRPLPRRVFKFTWETCVSYVATDETWAPSDRTGDQPLEVRGWVLSYRESSFLRYVSDTTYAVEHHKLELLHIRVGSYNWIVDVVSRELPRVIELETEYR